MANSIVFSKAYKSRNDIKFGVEYATVNATISATLRKPVVEILAGRVSEASISVVLKKPVVSMNGLYDNNVFRGVDIQIEAVHRDCADVDNRNQASWKDSAPLNTLSINVFDTAESLNTNVQSNWKATAKQDNGCLIAFDDAVALNQVNQQFWKATTKQDNAVSDNWQTATPADIQVLDLFEQLLPIDIRKQSNWKEADKINRNVSSSFEQAQRMVKEWTEIVDESKVRPGFSWKFEVEQPVEPPVLPIDNSIVFSIRWTPNNTIIFNVSSGQTTTIISKRTYYMLHEIEIKRVSDNKPINMSSVSVSTSQDDWGWKISGNIVGRTSYDDLRATPYTEILVSINGYSWRAFVVDLKESRTFGKGNYSLTAIGRGLELDAPFCMTQSKVFNSDKQVVQLANDELIDTGWSLNWTGNDWLVSSGSYSYANKTHIQAISEIAKLSGNFVYSDTVNKILNVRKRYKELPWSLTGATPDYQIPLNPIRELSKEYVVLPDYNSVYVSGGLLAKIKRTGSDGLNFADTVLQNPLITHTDGARAVGSEYLADNLSHYKYQYSTLLSNDVPLIDVGSIVEMTGTDNYKGLSQSVSITASLNDKSVKVVQQFEVRRWS